MVGVQVSAILLVVLCSPHHALARPLLKPIDMTSEVTSGLHDTQEFDAVKSATDLPASKPQSQICRRNLYACGLGLFRKAKAAITPTATRASESVGVTKTTAKLSFWQRTIDSFLWKIPTARDDYNLAYANYEAAIIKAIPRQTDDTDLSDLSGILLQISNTRQRMTSEFGYGREIGQWFMKFKMPDLAQELRITLEKTMNNLISDEGQLPELEQIAAIVKKIYESELQDKFLQPKLIQIDDVWSRFNEKFPNLEDAIKKAGLDKLAFPPSRPKFPGWTRLRSTSSLGRDLSWISYQIKAELDQRAHLEYLTKVIHKKAVINTDWAVVQGKSKTLMTGSEGSSLATQLKKGKFGIEDYKNLEALEQSRLGLIQKFWKEATEASSTEEASTAEIQELAMQGLLIESISGLHSRTALQMLQELSDQRYNLADGYLKIARAFQDKYLPPPIDLDWLAKLREPTDNLKFLKILRELKAGAPPSNLKLLKILKEQNEVFPYSFASWIVDVTDRSKSLGKQAAKLRRSRSI